MMKSVQFDIWRRWKMESGLTGFVSVGWGGKVTGDVSNHQASVGSFTCSNFSGVALRSHRARIHSHAARKMVIKAMADDDSMPSDSPSFSSIAEKLNPIDSKERSDLVQKVLRLAACTSRGRLASSAQNSMMDELVLQLESVNPNMQPMESDLINGEWKLIYFTKAATSSSPLAPLLETQRLIEFGDITQTIDFDKSLLTQEAKIVGFPGVFGSVVTSAKITPVGPERMEVVLENTQVKGDSLLRRIDLSALDINLPIGDLYQRVRGKSPETYIDTYYVRSTLKCIKTQFSFV